MKRKITYIVLLSCFILTTCVFSFFCCESNTNNASDDNYISEGTLGWLRNWKALSDEPWLYTTSSTHDTIQLETTYLFMRQPDFVTRVSPFASSQNQAIKDSYANNETFNKYGKIILRFTISLNGDNHNGQITVNAVHGSEIITVKIDNKPYIKSDPKDNNILGDYILEQIPRKDNHYAVIESITLAETFPLPTIIISGETYKRIWL